MTEVILKFVLYRRLSLRERALLSRSERRQCFLLALEGFDTTDDFHDFASNLPLASTVVGP